MYGVERWIVERMVRRIGSRRIRVVLWDGSEVGDATSATIATLGIHSRQAFQRILLDPEFQFAECYVRGDVTIAGDLPRFLEEINRLADGRPSLRTTWSHRLSRYQVAISRRRARQSVHHHYDLGDEFYRLWLGPSMTYTCAYFPEPGASLDTAQRAKLDHICRKLALRPGERVVEAGSGWGSLALHMAEHYGSVVKAYNISSEQVSYARAEAQERGLAGRVEFVNEDYRSISGRFDAFVSVGMLEHVGRSHYQELGKVIGRCLTDSGRGLIHSIGRHQAMPPNRWMQRRVFPDGYVPSLGEMLEIFAPNGFAITDLENLRLHYAKTLESWLQNFDRSEQHVRALFDDGFVRAWRLYLASSLASFRTGWHQLFQIVFTRAGNNEMPWTRDHVYGKSIDRQVPR